jgi:choloylglycine hydrolase
MMSATQFTAATDQKAMRFYYRTAYNSSIRCIDLKSVDFAKVKYQSHPLDDVKEEPVQMLKIG